VAATRLSEVNEGEQDMSMAGVAVVTEAATMSSKCTRTSIALRLDAF
jgi:hypothetical protein